MTIQFEGYTLRRSEAILYIGGSVNLHKYTYKNRRRNRLRNKTDSVYEVSFQ